MAGIANKIAFHNGLPIKVRPYRFLKQAFATLSNPDFMTETQYLLSGKIEIKLNMFNTVARVSLMGL